MSHEELARELNDRLVVDSDASHSVDWIDSDGIDSAHATSGNFVGPVSLGLLGSDLQVDNRRHPEIARGNRQARREASGGERGQVALFPLDIFQLVNSFGVEGAHVPRNLGPDDLKGQTHGAKPVQQDSPEEKMLRDESGRVVWKSGSAPFVCVRRARTPPPSAVDTRTFMEKNWKLKRPQVLLSITGAINDFALDPEESEELMAGLAETAKSVGGWFLTSGSHSGMAKYMGKALKLHADKVPIIGVVGLGTLKGRNAFRWREADGEGGEASGERGETEEGRGSGERGERGERREESDDSLRRTLRSGGGAEERVVMYERVCGREEGRETAGRVLLDPNHRDRKSVV